MKVSKDNPNIELIYTTLKGVKIYGFKDITQISAFRGVAAEKAKRFASLSITEDELKKLVGRALVNVNQKQDLAGAIACLHEINWRLETICEENSLLELAYIYCMLEGEDDEQPTQEWNKKKSDLVKSEVDLKAFFLRMALDLVNNFSAKPGVDLLTYLEKVKEVLEPRMSRFLD